MNEHELIAAMAGNLRNFKRKNDSLYEFSCNICGDSRKNKYKRRGNFFRAPNGGWIFHCYNCGASKSLIGFAKDYFPDVYRQHCFESFSCENEKTDFTGKKESPKLTLDAFPELIPCLSSSEALAYTQSRKIPTNKLLNVYYVKDANALIERFASLGYQRLGYTSSRLVFVIKDRDNTIIGFITRAIDKDDAIRYYNIKIDESKPFLYGIDKLNRTETVYILEGIIDSLFVNNALAVCSADFSKAIKYCKENQLDFVCVYDNEPYNEQIMTRVKKTIVQEYPVVLFDSSVRGKDINEMFLLNEGLNINELLRQRTYQGLMAKLELGKIT